ncbi:hypothetical protein NLG97_g7169 [Lecanicillium saksenae]|uniref:Uncharacterized protein n=1 Tax=Lecanicillium saksenae TaxID=468837 RepID=A0ACC1QML7_9HYPO|nr:hypothetical protein NLG97_g7169 [Lecanicillium saksenae]
MCAAHLRIKEACGLRTRGSDTTRIKADKMKLAIGQGVQSGTSALDEVDAAAAWAASRMRSALREDGGSCSVDSVEKPPCVATPSRRSLGLNTTLPVCITRFAFPAVELSHGFKKTGCTRSDVTRPSKKYATTFLSPSKTLSIVHDLACIKGSACLPLTKLKRTIVPIFKQLKPVTFS